jgi:hypothetical protein
LVKKYFLKEKYFNGYKEKRNKQEETKAKLILSLPVATVSKLAIN